MTECEIEFPGMVEKYYHSWLRFHPVEAADIGVCDFQDALPPISDDDQGALAALFLKVRCCMEENDPTQLTQEQFVDYQILHSSVQLQHRKMLREDWRRRNPLQYSPHGLMQLLLSPTAQCEQTALSSLDALPRYLQEAQRQMSLQPEKIPALWLSQAIVQNHKACRLLAQRRNTALASAAASTIQQAESALQTFSDYLASLAPIAQGSVACGADFFQLNLQLKHFIHLSPTQFTHFLQPLKQTTQQQLQQLSATPSDDYQALCQHEQPMLSAALATTHQRLYARINALNLLHTQDASTLDIIATSADDLPMHANFFYQHSKTHPLHGVLWVNQNCAGYPTPMLEHICTQQLWPGQHLLAMATHDSAGDSLPRIFGASSTLTAGWLLYIDQLLSDHAMYNNTEGQFLMLHARLKAIVLAELDCKLHTHTINIAKARDELLILGLDAMHIDPILSDITQHPGEYAGAVIGWRCLQSLLDHSRQTTAFDYRAFHQKLLSCGPIAVPIIIKRQWGRTVWDAIEHEVFSAN